MADHGLEQQRCFRPLRRKRLTELPCPPFLAVSLNADLVATRFPELPAIEQSPARAQRLACGRRRLECRAPDSGLPPWLLPLVSGQSADSLVVAGSAHGALP